MHGHTVNMNMIYNIYIYIDIVDQMVKVEHIQ